MKPVLEEPRLIFIAGRAEQFANYARLRDRAESLIEAIQRLEAGMAPGSLGDAAAWKSIEELATMLSEVIVAQRKWLDDNDRAIGAAIEELRRDIRSLNTSKPMEELDDD